jgi:uncharacterized protein YuzE
MNEKPIIDYDRESDVCYVNFHSPLLEADSANRIGDIIFRSRGDKPIGATILNFSKYEKLIKLLSSELPIKERIKK